MSLLLILLILNILINWSYPNTAELIFTLICVAIFFSSNYKSNSNLVALIFALFCIKDLCVFFLFRKNDFTQMMLKLNLGQIFSMISFFSIIGAFFVKILYIGILLFMTK